MAFLLTAAALGVVTAALAAPVVRRLPEPAEGDGKPSYASLATPAFIALCGAAAATAGLLTASLPIAEQPGWWVLGSAGVLLAAIDARTTWLPLALTRVSWLLMGLAIASAAVWMGDLAVAARSVIGAVLAGLVYLAVWLVSRGGFGFGDVRFATLVGAAAGSVSLTVLLWALVLGSLTGGLHGVVRMARRRRGGFGYAPSILAGAFLALALTTLTAWLRG